MAETRNQMTIEPDNEFLKPRLCILNAECTRETIAADMLRHLEWRRVGKSEVLRAVRTAPSAWAAAMAASKIFRVVF